MTGSPCLTELGTGVGVHNLRNAVCDKIVGTVAAHVLAVSGRGGVAGCLSPVPGGIAWGVGEGLGEARYNKEVLNVISVNSQEKKIQTAAFQT